MRHTAVVAESRFSIKRCSAGVETRDVLPVEGWLGGQT